MKFSVVVSLDNRYELTTNFIETLIYNTEFVDGELVIIADGCKDKDTLDYLERIRAQFDYVKLLVSEEKNGYSVANNTAVNRSAGDILVFINSDVLPCKNSIEKLVSYLVESESVGAVQGRLVYPQNNRIQSTGHLFMERHNSHVYKGKPSNHPLVLQQGVRQALTTAFCAIRKTAFYKHGGFDEGYFNAYDGMELTLKIALSGLKCVYFPMAVAYHITGATRSHIRFDNEMAGRRFWSKWNEKIHTDIHEYIMPQVTDAIRNQIYFLVNCSSLPGWSAVLQNIGIITSGEIKVRDRFETTIDLYNNLPFAALHYNGPYLFICNDSFALSGNYNWCAVRGNPLDLVIDGHGNVCPLQTLAGIEGP